MQIVRLRRLLLLLLLLLHLPLSVAFPACCLPPAPPAPAPLPVRVLPARAVLDLDVHEGGARSGNRRPRGRQHLPVSQLPESLLLLLLHLHLGSGRGVVVRFKGHLPSSGGERVRAGGEDGGPLPAPWWRMRIGRVWK